MSACLKKLGAMTRIRIFLVMPALAVLFVTAAAGPAQAVPDYPNCTGKLQYKPKSITVFCADGGVRATKISWSSWGERRARGSSTRTYVNDCEPSCAHGRFHRYSARLVLRRVRSCPSGRGRIFTRLDVTYIGAKPQGPREFTQRLRCPSR